MDQRQMRARRYAAGGRALFRFYAGPDHGAGIGDRGACSGGHRRRRHRTGPLRQDAGGDTDVAMPSTRRTSATFRARSVARLALGKPGR